MRRPAEATFQGLTAIQSSLGAEVRVDKQGKQTGEPGGEETRAMAFHRWLCRNGPGPAVKNPGLLLGFVTYKSSFIIGNSGLQSVIHGPLGGGGNYFHKISKSVLFILQVSLVSSGVFHRPCDVISSVL